MDSCDPASSLVSDPTALQPGTKNVTCTAWDQDGNESSCTIAVTALTGSFQMQGATSTPRAHATLTEEHYVQAQA